MEKRNRQGIVVGAGFQKTGTSTLREALKILGYRVKDTSARPLIPILKKDWKKVISLLNGYDAVEDTPWYMIYKEIDEHIPNSKFILTLRDEESWYKSVSKHIGDLKSANHEYVYGRGKSLPKDHKENTLSIYKKHNTEVQEYFKDRPNDLLVVDFTKGDGWEKLCPFLGKDIPTTPFPHYNKTNWKPKKRTQRNKFKFFRKRVKNNFRIWYIDQLGLWPTTKH